jgi:hypothetical protein
MILANKKYTINRESETIMHKSLDALREAPEYKMMSAYPPICLVLVCIVMHAWTKCFDCIE